MTAVWLSVRFGDELEIASSSLHSTLAGDT